MRRLKCESKFSHLPLLTRQVRQKEEKMEDIIELILELVLEGGMEASRSSKIPNPVRFLITALIVLFFIAVIGFIFGVGIILLNNDNIPAGIFLILMGAVMAVLSVIKFIRTYLTKRR